MPRICGICSVSQSVAAANALSALYGISPPPNGLHVRNLIHAVENIADHLSHFYLFFMPDFARADYRQHGWYDETVTRFQAQRGTAVAPMLEARAILMRFMGSLAGHWPHTLCLQPGGVTKVVSAAERVRLQQWLRSFRRYLEQHTFGQPLEAIAALDSQAALEHYRSQTPGADFAHFLHLADSLQLQQLGRSYDRFIAAAAYAGPDGSWSPAGLWQDGGRQPLLPDDISEDSHSSWLAGDGPAAPLHNDTVPLPDKAEGYSWSKAPRIAGMAAETGALARGLLRGEALLCGLVQEHGGNVLSRVVARLTEVARIVPQMEQWLAALQLEQAFQLPAPAMPQQGQAIGLTEAARGMLGHWVALDAGRISRYQIIAPTTWNFSPRDSQGQPGPLEKALQGVDASDPQALQVQHIVRSFDPCQVCTTH